MQTKRWLPTACTLGPGHGHTLTWATHEHTHMQVTVAGRGATRMTELKTGDRVLSVAKDGTPFYDPIYFWGHRDSVTISLSMALDVCAPARRQATIMLSPRCACQTSGPAYLIILQLLPPCLNCSEAHLCASKMYLQ